jgi:hypothetical protein
MMELVKSLSKKIEQLKTEHDSSLFEEDVEEFPAPKADVPDNPAYDDSVEYFIVVEVLHFSPNEPAVPDLNEKIVEEEDSSRFLQEISQDVFAHGIEEKDQKIAHFLQEGGVLCSPSFGEYSDEEQQSPTSHFDNLGSTLPMYDNYESYFELDIQDIQEHTREPYPLFSKEYYHEETSHPRPAEDTE